MINMPAIGTRVRYRSTLNGCIRIATGTVTKHYPGYAYVEKYTRRPVVVPDSVAVRVNVIPHWWPYCSEDTFAPDISKLTGLN